MNQKDTDSCNNETIQINKSLMALKSVILDQFKKEYCVSLKGKKVNFKEHLLTSVLRDSIDFKKGSQDTFTIIIATISNQKDDLAFVQNTLDFTKSITSI
mmetsp:Transcript_36407/g.79382  ORF Transcript_36407/g.79382 Transcript_36407/m.79382 type:complete len:100 (-) Transcript_36407:141-440(-)